MEPVNKHALGACLLAAILLAGGYGLGGSWLGVWAVLIMMASWFACRTYDFRWMPSVLLIVYTGIAAAGILTTVSPALMIAGSAFALAGWELADQGAGQGEPSTALRNLYQREHLKLALMSIGLGLLVAESGLLVQIAIPFGLLLLIALAVLLSLFLFHRSS